MRGYEISSLSTKTRELIKNEGIDVNRDGLINKDNGELAELLSRTGKKDINDLCYDSWFEAKKGDLFPGFILAFGGIATLNTMYWLNRDVSLTEIKNKARDLYSKSNGKFPIKECIQKGLQNSKITAALKRASLTGLFIGLGLFAFSKAIYLFTRKPGESVAKWIDKNDDKPVDKQIIYEHKQPKESEYKAQYIKVFGEDTKLKEYIPQKGEYWNSILKAKYGVDEAVALRMTHKIKDIIYGDSLAAKQSPVMYLPPTWTFEGKTYNYNENSVVEKAEDFSEDVKTEMGKMSKDIKYE